MQKIIFIFFSFAVSLAAGAQKVFETVLKKGPVVTGESFRVQYVLDDLIRENDFFPPDFKDFRFVSGPDVYEAQAYGTDGPKKLRNIVYTLEAVNPGRFMIKGASARVDDHFIKSDDVWLEVISRAEAVKKGLQTGLPEPDAAYFLRPGEDPYRKIRDNLFLKVMVDKRTCFVGEAVTATFKLYSRLMSKSDIVKNPGFYGFTVQDMIGLNDRQSSTETINGKTFDVHTIRKVQLYPLRPGSFTIDPMEVTNKVEFSGSAVNKKPEQEIVEGVFPDDDRNKTVNMEEYESNMSSPSLAITVKPSPSKNRPAGYTGATGNFSITASVTKNELAKNEEGQLVVRISGKGNFIQLPEPFIQWPAGIERFDSRVTDSLDHNRSPLAGTRTFRVSFVSARPGHYSIPAVGFSFFDPDSNNYKTISTPVIRVTISDREKTTGIGRLTSREETEHSYAFIIWLAGLIVFAAAGAWLVWFRKRKGEEHEAPVEKKESSPSVAGLLQPASVLSGADDKLFYTTLRHCIWDFFALHFGLAGSKMNTRDLLAAMQQKRVNEESRLAITAILQQCDTGIFADVYMEADKKAVLKETRETLEEIATYL
jgi:hypothetical protein